MRNVTPIKRGLSVSVFSGTSWTKNLYWYIQMEKKITAAKKFGNHARTDRSTYSIAFLVNHLHLGLTAVHASYDTITYLI